MSCIWGDKEQGNRHTCQRHIKSGDFYIFCDPLFRLGNQLSSYAAVRYFQLRYNLVWNNFDFYQTNVQYEEKNKKYGFLYCNNKTRQKHMNWVQVGILHPFQFRVLSSVFESEKIKVSTFEVCFCSEFTVHGDFFYLGAFFMKVCT